MDDDQAIRRAAGVIMWKMTHKDHTLKRPMTEEEAVLFAHNREPELTDGDMAHALEWAKRGIHSKQLFKVCAPGTRIVDVWRAAGLPYGPE